jgi:CBS domain-containing protein
MNLVQHIIEDAQRRLAVLRLDASVRDIAGILANPVTPLVVVCDSEGVALGVVSSADIVNALSREGSEAFNANAAALMTQPIHSCDAGQTLQSIWSSMGAGSHRCIPVLDKAGRPLGVVHARDVARALLDEVTYEEVLLRDYVLGIGYQ